MKNLAGTFFMKDLRIGGMRNSLQPDDIVHVTLLARRLCNAFIHSIEILLEAMVCMRRFSCKLVASFNSWMHVSLTFGMEGSAR